MARTNLKKNSDGYGYKYTDLAEIHNHLEESGMTYYQYIEPEDGVDYIWTVPIKDGKELPARRGCRIIEARLSGKENPVQAYGASLTYSRRYSLLMAMGLATTDDDAACITVTRETKQAESEDEQTKKDALNVLKATAKEYGVSEADILKKGKVKTLEEMNLERINNCIRWLNGRATA